MKTDPLERSGLAEHPCSKPLAARPAVAESDRIQQLDSLRGLAAVWVMLFHYTVRYDELFGHPQHVTDWFRHGGYGVDFFFMLSGFVIFMTLARTRSAWDFAVGRFSRLYPAYWAAAAITGFVVWSVRLPGQGVSLRDAVLNLTMVQQTMGAADIDGVYWSLQAELFFYAGMLALHLCGAFRRFNLAMAAWLGLATLNWWTSRLDLAPGLALECVQKLRLLLSLDFIHLFGVGILLYRIRQRGRASAAEGLLLAWCIALQGLTDSTRAAGLTLFLAIVLHLATNGRLRILTARPLVGLGAISYCLYLLHQNIGYAVIRHLQSLGVSMYESILAAIGVSLLLATLLHRCVERPAMTRLRQWGKRWSASFRFRWPRKQAEAPPVSAELTAHIEPDEEAESLCVTCSSPPGLP